MLRIMPCLISHYLSFLFHMSHVGSDGEKAGDKERTCDSLLMCIVTVLSHGLRSGGGVGDVLRKPSKEVL